jgi:GAF domain-containing protein
MSFVAGLRHALDLRQRDLVSELDRGDSLEDVLNRHLLTVEEMCDDEILTSVLLLSPDGKRLTHGAAPSLPQVYREAIDGSEIGPSAGSCGTAAYSGAPVYVTDIATDPRWAAYKHLALPHGLRSCWSTPIRHADGHVMGTFAIYHRTSCGPVRAELNAIQVIADNVAQAITWARDPDGRKYSFTLLPRQVAALEAITAAISSHASALDPEGQEAVDAVVQGSKKLAEVVRRRLAESSIADA